MVIFSFSVKDDSNIEYFGEDLSSIIDECFVISRRYIKGINLEKKSSGFDILILLQHQSSSDFITLSFKMPSFSDVKLSVQLNSEFLRVDNLVEKKTPEELKEMLNLIDLIIKPYCESAISRGLSSIEDMPKFKDNLDKIVQYIMY